MAGTTTPLLTCARSRYEGLVGMRTETRLRVEASGMAIVAASERARAGVEASLIGVEMDVEASRRRPESTQE